MLVSATVIREAENGLQRGSATGAKSSGCGRRGPRRSRHGARHRRRAAAQATVATNDPATVQDVVDEPAQLNSNLLLVTSRTAVQDGGLGGAAANSLASQPAVVTPRQTGRRPA